MIFYKFAESTVDDCIKAKLKDSYAYVIPFECDEKTATELLSEIALYEVMSVNTESTDWDTDSERNSKSTSSNLFPIPQNSIIIKDNHFYGYFCEYNLKRGNCVELRNNKELVIIPASGEQICTYYFSVQTDDYERKETETMQVIKK